MKKKIKPHPDLDFFAVIVGPSIPTKHDWFEKATGNFYIKEGGIYKIPKDILLYKKKTDSASYKTFKAKLSAKFGEALANSSNFPIGKETNVEVIIHVTITDIKRLKDVDVDNLAKGVLDCMNGVVYEDDTQIFNLLVSKDISEYEDSVMIGARKIDNNNSWFKDIYLAELEYVSTNGGK